jgi:hypothetical protein
MSDEQAMEIIENLSEELGEKELKIMALEKELEEQKKEKIEYYDLYQISRWAIDYMGSPYDSTGWSPSEIVGEQAGEPDEIIIKAILHYFGGRILTKEEHIEELDDFSIDYWEQYVDDNFCDIIDLKNGNFWISDEF